MTLAEKLLAIHARLDAGGFEHAFGGAIALAYWTLAPRATSDIDINIFAPSAQAQAALQELPPEIVHDDDSAAQIASTGQARLWWAQTPIDLFFDYEQLHADAARNRRFVAFAEAEIPVLGPVELACFKAVFDRTKDWADIEAMFAAETLDPDRLRSNLTRLLGADDHRLQRVNEALRRADAASPQNA